MDPRRSLRDWLRRLSALSPVALVFLCQLPAPTVTAAVPPASPSAPSVPASAPPLSLEGCLALALQKQPSLAVGRASLSAATDAQRALHCLRFPATLVPELPIRRHQAELGVTAATAGLYQDEQDVVYSVTRTYFTVVYAREQERLARSLVERLQTTHDLAARMLKEGARDVADSDVDRSSIYLDLAETKRMQATAGVPRALAALREAIGTGACAEFSITYEHLPRPDARPCREQVISLALQRRGDLIQVNTFAEIATLEIDAQKSSSHQRVETFAIGGDIHARPVPAGEHNHDYRPGALPPEMPAVLVGCTSERVARACSLSQRAAAAADKARGLITLEAEDAFYRWEEASQKAERAKRAAETGDKLAGNLSKDLAGGQRVKLEDVINAHVLASQARSQYNDYLYDQILALADLQRITAGGFCAGLTVHPLER